MRFTSCSCNTSFSLKPGGKAAVVVPTGFITAQSGIDKGIREHLVQNKMLAGVNHAVEYLRHHRYQRVDPVC